MTFVFLMWCALGKLAPMPAAPAAPAAYQGGFGGQKASGVMQRGQINTEVARPIQRDNDWLKKLSGKE
jgi:hypothetical protein